MKSTAHARFAIKSWDEKPYNDEPKMTRATVRKTYTGDLAGVAQVEYVMMYRSDGTASFVGLERFVGQLGGKSGSFVLQRTGVFEGGLAKENYAIIAGSGADELQGISGSGTSSVGHGMEHPFTLDYEFAR